MEKPVQFLCNHKRLYGVLHIPDGEENPATIVIIVTGGPQVRSGPHRLHIQLSRFLCKHNWSSLRFDYEGMGDSEGDFVGFQYAELSITAAIHFLQKKFKRKPNFIFWALCDGATATALYGAMQPEHISGMILCNPLVITDGGLARSTIKHYYSRRFFNKEFLRKLILFELDLKDSITSLKDTLKEAYFVKNGKFSCTVSAGPKLPQMVMTSLHNFAKPIRIILSTDDIVASNFQDELKNNKALKEDYKSKKIINHIVNGADHTFVDPMAKNILFEISLRLLDEINNVQ